MLLFLMITVMGTASQFFQSHDILDLTLEYDLKAFRKDIREKRDYHPATLSYDNESGQRVSLQVRIKTRGNRRRTQLFCSVPPIRMKFDDNKTANTIFEGEKKLKLVTHCKNSRKYEQYYIQEYLLYRVYSLLTPLSFRVRMANITYIDSRKKTKPVTNACFFIENFKQVAKRNNADIATVEKILVYQADRKMSILMAVFQFMIGNTDWSNNFGHNIKWLLRGNKKKYYPVPFDFDQAGMINTSYAKPDRILRIKTVRERLYRGHFRDISEFYSSFDLFMKHKEAIYLLYRQFPLLTEKVRRRSIKYLDSFYKIIQTPKLINRYFLEK